MTRTHDPHRPGRRGLARWATLVSFMAGMLALSAVPANADADSPKPREDHAMGSTIAEHENQEKGRSLTPRQAEEAAPQASVQGIDVSHHQGNINWSAVANAGIDFAYMKATEGTYFIDGKFDRNYTRSYNQGIIRGAYHFANPSDSGGAAQARFFVNNGGGWSADGKTLPPVLDIEYNPYGADCYGLTDGQMVNWITDFSNTVKNLSGRYPAIYTTTNWWSTCTGNYGGFADTNPLWIARWSSDPNPLPNGWGTYTIWQYTATGSVSGVNGNVDRNVFNGSYSRLKAFAKCTNENPC